MAMTSNTLFTIGHSNHPIEHLIILLTKHGVTAVADVRSSPYSRFNPQYNRESLQNKLKEHNIAYVFLGKELGARSRDVSCYENGRIRYERLAATKLFQEGLDRIISGMKDHCIALLCAEKDPLACHRTILVSRQIAAKGTRIEHILEDGELETHEVAVRRLLRELGLDQPELFRSYGEIIDDAYLRREQEISYVEPKEHIQDNTEM
jgi:uncharacterized protein (DUF488 family)